MHVLILSPPLSLCVTPHRRLFASAPILARPDKGVPVNTPEDVANVVVNLIHEGKKANGKGILVQGGKCADLERGIARTRAAWMGEEMLQLYKGGNGEDGVGIGQGTGQSKL